jgi:multidrug efflux pump
MNFTDIFIRKQVLSLVVTFVILVAGFQSIGSLNVRQYPRSPNAGFRYTSPPRPVAKPAAR